MRPQDADDVITKRRLSVCRSPGIIQSESSTLKSGSSCRFTWILRAERDVMLFSTGSVFIRHVWMKRDRERIKEQTRGGGKWINNKRRVSHEIWEEIRRKGRKGARLMRRRANRWITFRVFVCRREIRRSRLWKSVARSYSLVCGGVKRGIYGFIKSNCWALETDFSSEAFPRSHKFLSISLVAAVVVRDRLRSKKKWCVKRFYCRSECIFGELIAFKLVSHRLTCS